MDEISFWGIVARRSRMVLLGMNPDSIGYLSKSNNRIQQFQFSANMLKFLGIIKEKDLKQVERDNLSPEAVKAITAIRTGQMPLAQNILLSQSFLARNRYFFNSGIAIKIAIEHSQIKFAKQLINIGYTIPRKEILQSILDKRTRFLRNAIKIKFYHSSDIPLLKYLLQSNGYNHLTQLVHLEHSNVKDKRFQSKVLQGAIYHQIDQAAIQMINLNPTLLKSKLIKQAISKQCYKFLEYLWEQWGSHKSYSQLTKRNTFTNHAYKRKQSISYKKLISIRYIIKDLIKRNKKKKIFDVLSWRDACIQNGLVQLFSRYQLQDFACYVIDKGNCNVGKTELRQAIKRQQFQLAVKIWKFQHTRSVLLRPKIQRILVEHLKKIGSNMYYIIQLLSQIPTNHHFSNDQIKLLFNSLVKIIKYPMRIRTSGQPLLFIVLTTEFVQKFQAYREHENKSQRIIVNFLNLGKSIINYIKEESVLRYHLYQQDIKGRNVLSIAAHNRFYQLLDNSEVGYIIWNLWVGQQNYNSVWNASTFCKSIVSVQNSPESRILEQRLDITKCYSFNYSVYVHSCSLRFYSQTISTFALVLSYTLSIHFATQDNALNDLSISRNASLLHRISQLLILGIFLQQLLHILFGLKTKRGLLFDGWKLLDFLVFIMMCIIQLEQSWVEDFELIAQINFKQINTVLMGIQLFLIWGRLLSIMATSKQYGPLLYMIYLMWKQMRQFLFIFFTMIFAAAAVITSILSGVNKDFSSFEISIRTLYSSALGIFNMEVFTGEQKEMGEASLAIFLLLSYVLLLHLLIAILTHVYESQIGRVDSEYRALIIQYYNKWKWDKLHGFLIFLPSPLTIISSLLSPVIIVVSSKKVNKALSQIFYFIYVIPYFIMLAVVNLVLIIPVWIQQFKHQSCFKHNIYSTLNYKKIILLNVSSIKNHSSQLFKDTTANQDFSNRFSIMLLGLWFFTGIFRLLYHWLKECYYFWIAVYAPNQKQSTFSKTKNDYSKVDKNFLWLFQKTLKSFRGQNKVKVDSFIQQYFHMQFINKNKNMIQKHDEIMFLRDYLHNFIINKQKQEIKLNDIRLLLPKQYKYDKLYIKWAKNLSFSKICKGIKQFEFQQSSIKIQGLQIPKQYITGESQKVKLIDRNMKIRFCDFSNIRSQIWYGLIGVHKVNFVLKTLNQSQILKEFTIEDFDELPALYNRLSRY